MRIFNLAESGSRSLAGVTVLVSLLAAIPCQADRRLQAFGGRLRGSDTCNTCLDAATGEIWNRCSSGNDLGIFFRLYIDNTGSHSAWVSSPSTGPAPSCKLIKCAKDGTNCASTTPVSVNGLDVSLGSLTTAADDSLSIYCTVWGSSGAFSSIGSYRYTP